MDGQINDEFLIQLVGDISAIRTTVSNLKEEIERIDDRVVEPFQEWLHKIKSIGEKVSKIETDIESMKLKIEMREKDHRDLSHQLELINLPLLKTKVEAQETEQKNMSHRVDLVKYYAAGFVAAASLIGVALYKLAGLLFQLFSP